MKQITNKQIINKISQYGNIVGENLIIAKNPLTKLRGLSMHNSSKSLLLLNCNDVHTFTIFRNIDIYFLDKDFSMIKEYKNIAPLSRFKCKEATHTFEKFTNDSPNTKVTQKITSTMIKEE